MQPMSRCWPSNWKLRGNSSVDFAGPTPGRAYAGRLSDTFPTSLRLRRRSSFLPPSFFQPDRFDCRELLVQRDSLGPPPDRLRFEWDHLDYQQRYCSWNSTMNCYWNYCCYLSCYCWNCWNSRSMYCCYFCCHNSIRFQLVAVQPLSVRPAPNLYPIQSLYTFKW